MKLHLLTNFTPSLSEEKAIVDRTRYMFLDTIFSTADKFKRGHILIDNDFTYKLGTIYLNEIFTWIAKGAHEFYKDKNIVMPESFQIRTKQLFLNEDSVSTFIERRMIKTDSSKDFIKKGDLFEAYKTFCDSNSQRCHKRSELFDRLSELKYTTS
jgi:phage/plasmid-associated DNA primase